MNEMSRVVSGATRTADINVFASHWFPLTGPNRFSCNEFYLEVDTSTPFSPQRGNSSVRFCACCALPAITDRGGGAY